MKRMSLTKTYKELDKDTWLEALNTLKPDSSSRGFMTYTGPSGYKAYNKAIRVHFNLMNLNQAYEASKFTSDEYDSMKNMINSDDDKDVMLAESILETK